MILDKAYAFFYVEGREEKLLKNDIDTESLAKKVLAGKEIREVCVEAARSAARPLEVGRRKKDWVEDEGEAIKDAGGDADKAYEHYLGGRIDQLAMVLEEDVVEEIGNEVGESDGDEEDDEDSDDEDEDDDKEDK